MPLTKIKQFFLKNKICNCKIALALSGGTDSCAMFHILRAISDEFCLELSAIHINYHLRGTDSDEDELFVRNLCEKFNIKLFVKSSPIDENSSKIEEKARNIRYEYFLQIKSSENIDYIATAHNANDQAETLLFRLARKTGIIGAKCIVPVRNDGIIRPLLEISRSEIVDYMNKFGYNYREDKTNTDISFSRNRIRANIIPQLEKINPAAVIHIAKFCEIIQNYDNIYMEKQNLSQFFIEKGTEISEISELCFENSLILNEKHLAQIEKCMNNTGAEVLLPNFRMFVLLKSLFFIKNGVELQINKMLIDKNCETFIISDFWKVEIMTQMPKKGENFAVIYEDDFPLLLKKSNNNKEFMKNDNKSSDFRMKKAGLSKFERENSPIIISNKKEILAAAYTSWKFDGKNAPVKWLRIINN